MDRTVFTNANLVDGEHPAKPASTVIIEGNKITSVGTGTVTDLAAGDRVIDLGGRTIMPGMITCHFHATYKDLGSVPSPYGLERPPAYQAVSWPPSNWSWPCSPASPVPSAQVRPSTSTRRSSRPSPMV